MSESNRKEGWYWVKYDGEWVVAEWHYSAWFSTAWAGDWESDAPLDAIGPRIEPPGQ